MSCPPEGGRAGGDDRHGADREGHAVDGKRHEHHAQDDRSSEECGDRDGHGKHGRGDAGPGGGRGHNRHDDRTGDAGDGGTGDGHGSEPFLTKGIPVAEHEPAQLVHEMETHVHTGALNLETGAVTVGAKQLRLSDQVV